MNTLDELSARPHARFGHVHPVVSRRAFRAGRAFHGNPARGSGHSGDLPPAGTLTSEETRVLALLNATREKHGLCRLTLDPTLIRVAHAHCADMDQRNYFSHWEPDAGHRDPVDRYAAALGYRPTVVVGENLGTFTRPDFDAIHEALMNSPTHRANILDTRYTCVGIGVLVRSDGGTWVTQMFRGGPESGTGVLPVLHRGAESGAGVSPVLHGGTEKAG